MRWRCEAAGRAAVPDWLGMSGSIQNHAGAKLPEAARCAAQSREDALVFGNGALRSKASCQARGGGSEVDKPYLGTGFTVRAAWFPT